jgi:hypothetical protein
VIVTSDPVAAVEYYFESVTKPKILREYILKEAKIKDDGHSWIAAEIKVKCNIAAFFLVIPFYLQSVPVHSANCVKTCIQSHVEECSLVLLYN